MSAWWQAESDQYGGAWVQHDERYARTEEFLAVLKGMWTKDDYTLEGDRLVGRFLYLHSPIRIELTRDR